MTDHTPIQEALDKDVTIEELARENERLREALRSAKRLCDNIDEFGCVTDEEFYSVAERQIRAALGKEPK